MLFKTISLTAISSTALILSACFVSNNTLPTTDTSRQAGLDWCFSNGPIYTANNHKPIVDALAVKNGQITYIGDKQDNLCENFAGKKAQKISLSGRALFPGFTDAHGHLIGIGLREMTLNLEGTTSIEELKERLAKEVLKTPKGETIYGRGWIETHWPENRFPNRDDLDGVSPDHPVILERADGHAVVVNSVALIKANVTNETVSPFGGDILKDDEARPTGMLIDRASDLVMGLTTKMTPELKAHAYKTGAALYARRGWTNIHSMSVDPSDVPIMETLANDNEIGIRVYNSLDSLKIMNVSDIKNVSPNQNPLITTRSIKLYSDGALGSRGAALLEPYDDNQDNDGLLLVTKEKTMPLLKQALIEGVQINTHAIGDRANRMVLDWYEEAMRDVPIESRRIAEPRWRIEHAQILNHADIPRFKELGVIASMQPSHAIGDLHFAPDRIGKERLAGGYAWRSLIDNGAIIAGGSDAPVEVGDPLIEFYAASMRKDLKGYSNDNWYLNEKVTRQEALKMFTIWPAIAAFEDDKTGSLEVGKRADITIFDQDIMTIDGPEILQTKAVMTIVDGKAVYSALP